MAQHGLIEIDTYGTYLENASHYLCLEMSQMYCCQLYDLDGWRKGRSPDDRSEESCVCFCFSRSFWVQC